MGLVIGDISKCATFFWPPDFLWDDDWVDAEAWLPRSPALERAAPTERPEARRDGRM